MKHELITTGDQKLLLKALLGREDEKFENYIKWADNTDLENIDGGTYRLMPLLYESIKDRGAGHRCFGKIKGIYKYYLFKNSLILHKFYKTAMAFDDAGIRMMVLKGVALVLAYYHDPALRPMNDMDILIGRADLKAADELLKSLGWKRKIKSNIGNIAKVLHSAAYLSEDGFELDLHWNSMFMPYKEDVYGLWRDAEHVEHKSMKVSVPGPEDQIILNCVHGVMWNLLPPIRWIPDMVKIIETRKINWEKVYEKAASSGLRYALAARLSYLKTNFRCAVPDDFMVRVSKEPFEVEEIKMYEALIKPHSAMTWKRVQWLLHRRRNEEKSLLYCILKFPFALKTEAGYDSYSGYAIKILRGCKRIINKK